MTERKRKTCQVCGRPYVPTSNVQKYCPDCRDEMKRNGGSISDAYKAYKKAGAPGPVRVTQIETPEAHLMDFTETPEDPAIVSGYEELQKAIDMPDGLAFADQVHEILVRYYTGELVDKNEFLARIQEKLGEF